jgi:hypothetical protein
VLSSDDEDGEEEEAQGEAERQLHLASTTNAGAPRLYDQKDRHGAAEPLIPELITLSLLPR